MSDFSSETRKAREECNIFKVQTEKTKTCQPRILYTVKLFLKNRADIKIFSDEGKLREFTANSAVL